MPPGAAGPFEIVTWVGRLGVAVPMCRDGSKMRSVVSMLDSELTDMVDIYDIARFYLLVCQ